MFDAIITKEVFDLCLQNLGLSSRTDLFDWGISILHVMLVFCAFVVIFGRSAALKLLSVILIAYLAWFLHMLRANNYTLDWYRHKVIAQVQPLANAPVPIPSPPSPPPAPVANGIVDWILTLANR